MKKKLREIILNYSKSSMITLGMIAVLNNGCLKIPDFERNLTEDKPHTHYLEEKNIFGLVLNTEITENNYKNINCYGLISSKIIIKENSKINSNINNFSLFSTEYIFEKDTILNGNLSSKSMFYNRISEKNTIFTGDIELIGLYNEVLCKIIPYYAKLENLVDYKVNKRL